MVRLDPSIDVHRAWTLLERTLPLDEVARRSFLDAEHVDDETRSFVVDLLDRCKGRGEVAAPAIEYRYRLLAPIGEGGLGEVFIARSTRPPKRIVALKLLRPGRSTPEVLRRFESEQQALARLEHRGIATIFEAGAADDGRPFFAMPLVRGEPITTHADRHRLGVRNRVALVRELADAVAHAHRRGVLHRDLKPANVLVEEREGGPQPVVIDFGIAKSLDEPLAEVSLVTEAGAVVGTPEYMSPEQADGLPESADVRSDVYALGVILHELLCGRVPIDRETLRRGGTRLVGATIRNTVLPPPSRVAAATTDSSAAPAFELRGCRSAAALAATLRGDLDAVCLKCLAPDQRDRYASADALVEDLDRHLAGEPVLARTATWGRSLRSMVRRHRTAVAVASSVILILAAGLIASGIFASRAARQSEETRLEADRAEALASFLGGIFSGLDPVQARGRDTALLEMLLDDAAAQLSSGTLARSVNVDPALLADLELVLGTAYSRLGLLDPAERHLVAAYEQLTSERVLATGRRSHEPVIELLKLRRDQMDHPACIALADELLQASGWSGDPDDPIDPEVLLALSSAGLSKPVYAQGHLKELEASKENPQLAAAWSELMVETATRQFGPNSLEAITATAQLGRLLDTCRQTERSRLVLEELLPRAVAALGPRHPITLSTAFNLLITLSQLDGTDPIEKEASELHWLAEFEAVYGRRHPVYANMLFNCSWTLALNGKLMEAIPMCREAFETYRDTRGAFHPLTTWFASDYLAMLREVKDAPTAEKLIQWRFEDAGSIDPADTGATEVESHLRQLWISFSQWTGHPPAVEGRWADRCRADPPAPLSMEGASP